MTVTKVWVCEDGFMVDLDLGVVDCAIDFVWGLYLNVGFGFEWLL